MEQGSGLGFKDTEFEESKTPEIVTTERTVDKTISEEADQKSSSKNTISATTEVIGDGNTTSKLSTTTTVASITISTEMTTNPEAPTTTTTKTISTTIPIKETTPKRFDTTTVQNTHTEEDRIPTSTFKQALIKTLAETSQSTYLDTTIAENLEIFSEGTQAIGTVKVDTTTLDWIHNTTIFEEPFTTTVATLDCPTNKYTCQTSNQCIDLSQVCDGHPDCNDASDELPCVILDPTENIPPSSQDCPEFNCQSEFELECIPYDRVCDGTIDCFNELDETDCKLENERKIQQECQTGEYWALDDCLPCSCSGVSTVCSSFSFSSEDESNKKYYKNINLFLNENIHINSQIISLEVSDFKMKLEHDEDKDGEHQYHFDFELLILDNAVQLKSLTEKFKGSTKYLRLEVPEDLTSVGFYNGLLEYDLSYDLDYQVTQNTINYPDLILENNKMEKLAWWTGIDLKDSDETDQNNMKLNLVEDNFQTYSGELPNKKEFLHFLKDLKYINIRLNYDQAMKLVQIRNLQIQDAFTNQGYIQSQNEAYEIEVCECPTGYLGTSCEDCDAGYRKVGYLCILNRPNEPVDDPKIEYGENHHHHEMYFVEEKGITEPDIDILDIPLEPIDPIEVDVEVDLTTTTLVSTTASNQTLTTTSASVVLLATTTMTQEPTKPCNRFGTINFIDSVKKSQSCPCKPGYKGPECKFCARKFYRATPSICLPCECNGYDCNKKTGECDKCPSNKQGLNCTPGCQANEFLVNKNTCMECFCNGLTNICSAAKDLKSYQTKVSFSSEKRSQDFGILINQEYAGKIIGTRQGPQLIVNIPKVHDKDPDDGWKSVQNIDKPLYWTRVTTFCLIFFRAPSFDSF